MRRFLTISLIVVLFGALSGAASNAGTNIPPPVDLEPVGGAGWEDAGGIATLSEFYVDHPVKPAVYGVTVNAHGLPCLHPNFYVLYVTIDGEDPIRGFVFNSDCHSRTGNAMIYFTFLPPADWLEREVAVDVVVEADDGFDGGTRVLAGTYTP